MVEMVVRHGVRMSHRRPIAISESRYGGSGVGSDRWHHHGSLLVGHSLLLDNSSLMLVMLLVLEPVTTLLRSVRVVHHRIGHLEITRNRRY